jgi:hypothetical protein
VKEDYCFIREAQKILREKQIPKDKHLKAFMAEEKITREKNLYLMNVSLIARKQRGEALKKLGEMFK